MIRKRRLFTGLSAAALSGSLALTGCGSEGEAEGEGGAVDAQPVEGMEGEGEGAGISDGPTDTFSEGEGLSEGEGESEGATLRTDDPANDDVEYYRRLGLVRGHLAAFIELYRAGAYDAAITHAKHPESELYQSLLPALEARSMPGFAAELDALAGYAADRGDVEGAYDAALSAIRANMPSANVKTQMLGVAEIVKTSGEEFDLGVNDEGNVEMSHEYQDAYGFLIASRELLADIETNDINAGEAIAVAHEQIDLALASFEGLTVSTTSGRAETIYGAAARIEIMALGL